MQRLEVSGAVRPIYGSLGVKRLTSVVDGVGGQRHAPAGLPPGKTRYPLYRRLGGPQSQSGQVWKISPPAGFDSRTVQPVASRHTDWAITAYDVGRVWRKISVSQLTAVLWQTTKCAAGSDACSAAYTDDLRPSTVDLSCSKWASSTKWDAASYGMSAERETYDTFVLLLSVDIKLFKAYRLINVPPGLKLKNSAWWLHCIYMFCKALRTNRNFCLIHHW